ncbi:hypothetical protein O1L44_22165 [Streptomyces noursei]|nr:hypothetical protein [Streptomyces noursei]
MTEPTADQPLHTADQATARVLDWWENHRGDASRADLVVDRDRAAAGAVVREVHRRVPGSVLLDAAGKSAEGLLRELLAELGVLEKCRYSFAWGQEIRRLGRDHLVLIDRALSAGPTRRSAQPGLVVQRLAEQLRLTTGIGVVLAVPPEHKVRKGGSRCASPPRPRRHRRRRRPRSPARPGARLLRAAPGPAGRMAGADQRGHRRRPRRAGRGHRSGSCPGTEAELLALAAQFPDHLRCVDGHVGFHDESTAEAIRRAHGPELPAAVGRHLVAWLRERAADFRHPTAGPPPGPSAATPPTASPCTPCRRASSTSWSATGRSWPRSRRMSSSTPRTAPTTARSPAATPPPTPSTSACTACPDRPSPHGRPGCT